jgi:DNA-binding transcriptional ArsR family regulator
VEESQAVDAFAALAQEGRLKILRLLVRAGPEGLAAGAIAETAGLSASNASFHLSHLERTGLVRSRREARSIRYTADFRELAAAAILGQEADQGGDPRILDQCFPGAGTRNC